MLHLRCPSAGRSTSKSLSNHVQLGVKDRAGDGKARRELEMSAQETVHSPPCQPVLHTALAGAAWHGWKMLCASMTHVLIIMHHASAGCGRHATSVSFTSRPGNLLLRRAKASGDAPALREGALFALSSSFSLHFPCLPPASKPCHLSLSEILLAGTTSRSAAGELRSLHRELAMLVHAPGNAAGRDKSVAEKKNVAGEIPAAQNKTEDAKGWKLQCPNSQGAEPWA